MALKIILSAIGIVGSFTSAVLFSNNNSRSGERASNSPYHSWKFQPIKSIEIPFSCVSLDTRSFQDRNKYTFKVIFDVKELEVKNFLEVDSTGVGNAGFEFVTDKAWGSDGNLIKNLGEKLFMNVSGMNSGAGEGIKVVINNQEHTGYKSAEFACSDKSNIFTKLVESITYESGENVIFFSSMSKSGRKLISMNGNSDHIKVELEKSSCKVEENNKRVATCDLKLSDAHGNKWSAKFPKEAKLTFS